MPIIHPNPHPQADQVFRLQNGDQFYLEDWYDRISRQSWMDAMGDTAVMHYALRVNEQYLPEDDEVVYGQSQAFGRHLVHVSELR